jgi:hypothetical protein
VVALVRDGRTRTLIILSSTGQEASAHWSADVPPATEEDLAEAVAAMHRVSGGDADAIRRALLRTDSPAGALADLVALLDLPPVALRMLDAEERDLPALGEGLLRGNAESAWVEAGLGPGAPAPTGGRATDTSARLDQALERTERAFGWTWIVLGALITLLGAFAAGAGASMDGGTLLPGNAWLLVVIGLALVVVGLTRRRR